MCKKKYIKRCVLDISLVYKAELKRILIGYLVKISIKDGRHQPIRSSNKGRKYLIFNGLGIGPLY